MFGEGVSWKFVEDVGEAPPAEEVGGGMLLWFAEDVCEKALMQRYLTGAMLV